MGRYKKILVANDDDFGDGLSYVLDLVKMMDRVIAILLLHEKRLSGKFKDLLTAITFAEANEYDTAREILNISESNDKGDEVRHILEEKCNVSGISTTVHTAGNLTSNELNKLVRTASRPRVTIAKDAKVA